MVDHDFMPIRNWDHIEFYVGNAKQAAHYYSQTFGFQPVAYAGLETGVRDRASYVLQQGKIRFVLTSGLHPDSEIARFAFEHGDGIKDIALEVPDATRAYDEALKRGAKSAREPQVFEDENGRVTRASIYTYGDTIHSFIERANYHGPFLPGYRAVEAPSEQRARDAGLRAVDHCVGNVELGKMNTWVLPARRRKAVECRIRSRSRSKQVRSGSGSSGRARSPAPPERVAPGARAAAS